MEVYLGLSGQTYNVGDALSDEAIGAEGSICEIIGDTELVAKIYHDDMAESECTELESKLKLMINKKIVEAQGVFSIAWPRDILYKNSNSKRVFAGYTMRKVSASYNLSDLTHHNPDDPDPDPNGIDGYITWKEFIQAAYNLSRLVEYLHKNGIEIGDFNERNFLFDETTGGFDLIDCGAYGIFDTKTLKTIYPCRYSMPKYSAPEKLLGLDISNPKSTDCFYLAIHIFHLLMQNSEPFGYKENSDGNPISKLHEHISNGDCIYVRSIPGKVLRKHSIKPGVLPDDILEAFNRTFNYTRDNIASKIQNRTTASEWCKVLEPYLIDDSRIIRCSVKKEHVYSSHLTECPWCNPSSVSDIPFEQRVNSSTGRTQLGGEGAKIIRPNDPCPCGSGKKYKNCHGKTEDNSISTTSTTNNKLSEACDILVKEMRSGDDYSVSKPIDEKNVFITLNGIRKIESFFKIENINNPENEQIEKGVREAICRKERKQSNSEGKSIYSDTEAASFVTSKINAIGKISNTEECGRKIREARLAFSNLTVPQRLLVNTDKLEKAEAEYKALKKKTEFGSKKKRNIAIAAAVLAVCLGAFALFKTGVLNLGGNSSALSDSFISSAKQGDVFTLGKYEQDNNLENGAEDIEWVVVNNENGVVLAVSKYCLDNKAFNESETYSATDWENCSLRQWLNQDFYSSSFSDDEKGWICSTNLHNTDADFFKTPGGSNTIDKVFLLGTPDLTSCYSDYNLGLLTMSFGEENKRMVKTTADDYEVLQVKYTDYAKETYIKAQCESWKNRTEEDIRADYAELEEKYGENASHWWLRTPGDNWYSTMTITWSGSALDNPSQSATIGVRPAIVVSVNQKTSSSKNTNAGNSTTANNEAETGSEIVAEEYDATDSGIPTQIVRKDQQMLFTLKDGKVGRIGYEMKDYSDIFDWENMKKVAAGNGIVIGLTNEGTLRISTAVEYDFDNDSLLKLSGIEDVCICDNAVNPKDENHKGCILCLANDGTVYLSFNGGYGQYSEGVKAIDASYNKYALLMNDGTVTGQKYDNGVYAEVPEWTDITQVVCGENYIAGLKSDGTVITSGNYLNREIDGSSIAKEDWSYEELDLASDVSSWNDIVYLSAGLNHLVGLRNDGTVLATGINNYGQCGTENWTGVVSLEASNNITVGYLADGSYLFAGKDIIENVIDLQDKYSVYIGYSR